MNSKSDNIEIMIGTETDDIIKELFESFLKKYRKNLEEKVFKSVDLLYYSLHKITLKKGGSYIKSPERLRNKTATINTKSTDNKCFRDAITPVLNYGEVPNHPERISNLMPFFDQYN